jgi:PKD repeat protein
MKHLRTLLLLSIACLVASPALFPQNTSTQGKEFWLSFMHNGFKDHTSGGWVVNQVLISAKRDCTGTVSNPLTGWSQSFSASANGITTVEIPEEQGYHNRTQHELIYEKGIKVTASDTVSVYCTNIAYVSFDASFVLPVESLGDEYIIQCGEQSRPGHNPYVWNNETTAFVIVATEDNTEVDITPTVNTLGGHGANRPFTVTLHAGETYHVRSERLTGNPIDLSGTRIRARNCKRIAVFNGNTITCVPSNAGNGYDHVFEQAMPLRSWGKNFIVTSSKNRMRDFVKVTSSADGNIVAMNGETLDTLMAGQSYYFPMLESEGSCYLQTTQPSAVYLYQASHDATQGDPSMVWIAPVEQRISDVTFSTFDHPDINIVTHSVNIIVHTKDSASVHLDGQQVPPSAFIRVNGNNGYSYARLDISHGVHRITCENGFNAHVYGFGDAKGYAYLVGSTAADLSTAILVDGEAVQQYDTISSCSLNPIAFGAEINYQDYELEWDFGDGTPPSHDATALHSYDDYGLYGVTLTVNSEEIPCQASTTITRTVYINLSRASDTTIYANTCYDGPSTFIQDGFSIHYDNPGTYEDSITVSQQGCENTVHLVLEVDSAYDDPDHPLTIDTCNFYLWNGSTYEESGIFSKTLTSSLGCDSVVHLDLTLSYSPKPYIESEDPNPHWPITATEFNVNRYTYHANDSIDTGTWHTSQCRWGISKDSWRIVPNPNGDDPFECLVYPMDWTEDTVWLSFKAVNDCDSVTLRYDLHPSFYGVHENGSPLQPGSESLDVTLLPNPTTGRVTLRGENLRQVVVVNLLGQQMLSVQGKGDELHIDMAALSSGVYFVTVTDEEGRKCVRKVMKE